MNEFGPIPTSLESKLPKELVKLQDFYKKYRHDENLSLNENSLYHEYEAGGIDFLSQEKEIDRQELLEVLKENISKNNLAKDEFEGLNNFCITVKNLLEAKT